MICGAAKYLTLLFSDLFLIPYIFSVGEDWDRTTPLLTWVLEYLNLILLLDSPLLSTPITQIQ